ncbi:MAG: exodeoxyribonuclease VII small subunit [Candidatus Methanoperedenaceae archaeon]|nr:exodeoxyribonuclease VII small subunit [Candidatus Methanoperedenaceae archaeon]MDW7727105.1 exodeoxyribonuclease VII small subunit [Candidatus Methanoperedens sp.]
MVMNFEEALQELENIVDKLEDGQLSLDESLMLFEKGIKLVNECNTKLNTARQKVEKLVEENGNLKSESFELQDADTSGNMT